jgi:methionyl aminopeptidase
MITLKTEEDVRSMRRAGQVVADVLRLLRDLVRPGVSTLFLDTEAEGLIRRAGGSPAFKGYTVPGIPMPFPGSICASINDEVVHGIPDARRILQEGDIISVDVGVFMDGFYGDAACTYPVGSIAPLKRKLLDVTLESLHRGLSVIRSGNTLGDIGHAVESTVLQNGFGLVRTYAGHGIGRRLHEPPQVPNYGRPRSGITLKKGMTIAVEPMVMSGGEKVVTTRDKWTVVTADGSDAAHFEHSVLVLDDGVEILTPWEQ